MLQEEEEAEIERETEDREREQADREGGGGAAPHLDPETRWTCGPINGALLRLENSRNCARRIHVLIKQRRKEM